MPEDRMAAFWDARAREDARFFVDNRRPYRGAADPAFWAGGERDLAQILGLLELTIGPTDTVLDLGCGPGRLSRAIAARAGAVIGLDVSAEMLALARAENAELGNVTWRQGDGVSLAGVADASVDGVISHVVFQHIPDPRITLGYVAEIGRVLRPGGWAGFQVSNDPGVHRPPRQSFAERVAVRLGRAPRGQRDPAWLGSAIDLGELRTVAAAAGLSVERVVGEGSQFCLVRVRRG